ncbi:hypothetical protein YDYSG_27420 [Paenibacillus tyrfis]|uniref:hypothetical protein n=1 Tax=Paenibacillus tyrfis TaxID=1501230 RepID=UPI002490B601|nr:hypothetical protein [Paenibacillus tyrfis]GLI06712.1 hypothetical protein YDYSG_27420 [Paenibacillus tyrfis]
MVDSIIYYYRNKVTSYSLVFKYMKTTYFLVRLLMFNFLLSSILLLPNCISLFIDVVRFTPFIWYFIISGLFLVISLIVFNRTAKQLLKNKYSIQSKKKIWRTKEFEDMRIKMMSDYLLKNNLYSEKKIVLLREMLNKKLNNIKLPTLLAPGLLLAFIGPVWVEFVKFTFQKNVTSIEQAAIAFMAISITVVAIIASFNGGKVLYKEIRELFLMNDAIVIKFLIDFLDDIELVMPEETTKR